MVTGIEISGISPESSTYIRTTTTLGEFEGTPLLKVQRSQVKKRAHIQRKAVVPGLHLCFLVQHTPKSHIVLLVIRYDLVDKVEASHWLLPEQDPKL